MKCKPEKGVIAINTRATRHYRDDKGRPHLNCIVYHYYEEKTETESSHDIRKKNSTSATINNKSKKKEDVDHDNKDINKNMKSYTISS